MDERQVIQLLKQVSTIDDAYKIVKQNTGEDFNVFSILGMETAEVKTHSKFIAELLNPQGSHLQGEVFLKIFIEYLNNLKDDNDNTFLSDLINIVPEKSKVILEKHIGQKTETEGGRIDIAIEDASKNVIFIENKIYAGEQEGQMLRYFNHGQNYPKCHLIFLTLKGDEYISLPKEIGTAYCLSYEKHIIGWLELCKKEAVNLPILREGIGQYINLIKKLTHQTTNKKMERDLNKIIIENYKQSSLIYQNFERAVFIVLNNIISIIEIKLKNELKENYPEWELYRIGKINSISDKGNLFIKSKTHGKAEFGIEEFNPLCKHAHFNHRIFFGIINWDKDLKFLEIAKDLNNDSFGFWINYKFPESEKFDFSLSTSSLIEKLKSDKEQEEFAAEIYSNFISYFAKYQKDYLDYLSLEDLRK